MRVLKYYPSFITALIPLSLSFSTSFFLSVFGEIEATYAMYVFHLGPYIAPCVCARAPFKRLLFVIAFKGIPVTWQTGE